VNIGLLVEEGDVQIWSFKGTANCIETNGEPRLLVGKQQTAPLGRFCLGPAALRSAWRDLEVRATSLQAGRGPCSECMRRSYDLQASS
jgi:hypothetical protein